MNISFWKTTVKPPNKKTSQRVNLNVRLISRLVIFRTKYKTAYNPIKIAVAVYISLSKKYDKRKPIRGIYSSSSFIDICVQ